jgi:beta-lactamase regulating signal transducer with metallopeptidase domain
LVAPAIVGLRTRTTEGPPVAHALPTPVTAVGVASPTPAPIDVHHTPRLRVRLLVLLSKVNRYVGRAWLAGSLAYLLFLVVGAIAIHQRRRDWREAEVDGEQVLISHDMGPAVIGAISPRIVVPEWALALDAQARALMLRHESEHIAARDPFALIVAVLCTVVFPWNAAVWAIVRRLRLAIEVDCDQRVLRATTRAGEYAELLLTVGARPRARIPVGASLAERHGLLEKRIKAMTPIAPRHPRLVAATLVVAALAVTTAAVRAPRPAAAVHRSTGADSLTAAEVRALLVAYQPQALVAASGINTVTILLDANGNYIASVSERREVNANGGGRGGRGVGGRGQLVLSGDLSTAPGERGIAFRTDDPNPVGGRARGNVTNGLAPDLPAPPGRIVKSNEQQTVNSAGDTIKTVRVTSLSTIDGDTVLLSFHASSGETGFIKHVNIVLHGRIGAGELFGFNENVLANLVDLDQVDAVHAHAYAGGEVGDGRLNVFMVRLKP